MTAQTFPISEVYNVEQALTALGTGEALVTGLAADGDMTPTAATRLMAPQSSMDPVETPAPEQHHVEPAAPEGWQYVEEQAHEDAGPTTEHLNGVSGWKTAGHFIVITYFLALLIDTLSSF